MLNVQVLVYVAGVRCMVLIVVILVSQIHNRKGLTVGHLVSNFRTKSGLTLFLVDQCSFHVKCIKRFFKKPWRMTRLHLALKTVSTVKVKSKYGRKSDD